MIARWCGAGIGTAVLITSLVVAGVFIFELPQLEQDAREALVIIFASLAAGAVLGALPLYFAARAYAKAVFALVSVALITAGLAMLVTAPVIRQMNTPELAEYRGFAALLWFGVVALVLGLGLAAACVYWSMQRPARRRLARWSRLIATAYGVLLGLFGVVMMFVVLASAFANETTFAEDGSEIRGVETALAITAIAMFLLVPGVILTYHGISASMGEGSSPFRPPVAALGVGAFGVVMALGNLNMTSDDPIALPMPVLHVLAAALPGLTFAAMASRGSVLRGKPVSGLTWRQVTLAMAISMAVATWIAVYVESIGSTYAVVLLLVHNGVFESARNADGVWDRIADANFILTENEQFVAGFIAAAMLAPIVEEFAKGLSVRFLMRPNTTRAQAFALGAYAGAAFGFLEAMLYGIAGIGESLGDWWQIMLLRGGSTSLHVLCTGLVGLSWWYWTNARRHKMAASLFTTAVAIHAGWNGVFTVLESRIFGLETLSNFTLEVVAYSVVIAASAAMIVAIPLIARRLRDLPPPAPETTPLGAMAPWLGG